MELNEKMYYACGLCSTDSKVQWHRPGTKLWHEHKEHIDLDETNSDRPKYFWCTLHRRPHDFKRGCLKYKAHITFNGKVGNINNPTKQPSHNDILMKIRRYIAKHSDAVNWKGVVHNSTSLPWPCTKKTCLTTPDLIYCKPNKSAKFEYSITNIIEFESESSATSIANKVRNINMSSKQMIENFAQSVQVLPRVIYLYDKQTKISIEEVKKAVQGVNTDYLNSVIVEYYDNGWFERCFNQV